MKNVAILVSSENDSSIASFIKNHIECLPFNVTVFYSGYIPHRTSEIIHSKWRELLYSLYDSVTRKATSEINTYQKKQFKRCLKHHKIDFVFAEFLITGGYAVDLCKEMGVPILATALGYDISKYNVMEQNKDRYKRLFDYAKAVVVVSEHMKVNLKKYGCPMDKVVFSPAGPEDSFFKLEPNYKSEQFFGLGRFVYKKAPHITILAFSKVLLKFPNATLVLGGDGPLLSVCEDLVSSLKIDDNVKFIGRINQKEQMDFLATSLAFVQHSKVAKDGDNEGTPVAILEASAAGIPIISTIHGGIPGVVINEETGLLCEENDMEEMSKNMLKLLMDKKQAERMGKAGKEYVKQNFTLNQHIEVLSSIINSK
jgi:colanic acid/amylovoran biosynthesis glycosyltransferase